MLYGDVELGIGLVRCGLVRCGLVAFGIGTVVWHVVAFWYDDVELSIGWVLCGLVAFGTGSVLCRTILLREVPVQLRSVKLHEVAPCVYQ